MGGLIQTYRTGGALSSSGGSAPASPTGVPLGPFANWAALPVSGETGALATVTSIGPGNATGTAIWSGTEWQLYRGIFDTVADMTAFAEPIATGALASVEETGDDNENGVRYQYDGAAWVRTAALSSGFAWALSSQWDFSAVGLQEGDYGLLVLSGGPVLLRYKVVTIAAGAGGGTVPMWIPPAAYAGTGLEVDCYAVGTESDAQLSAQALPVTEANTGTVSAAGGYIRLDAPAVGSGNSAAQLTSPVLTGAKKWWLTFEVRGAVAGNAACGIYGPTSELATQWALALHVPAAAYVQNIVQTTAGVWASATGGGTSGIRGGGSAWPASTPWIVHVLTGAAISDNIETLVDGTPYQCARRNADGATTGANLTMTPLCVGGTAGTSARLELRNYYRLTWD